MTYRIFHATGPGNIIEAHKYWSAGQHYPNEVSITFSSQFEDFCQDVGAEAYIVAYHSKKAIYHDGPFTLEHRPKPMPGARGLRYHIAEALYGLGLLFNSHPIQSQRSSVRCRAPVTISCWVFSRWPALKLSSYYTPLFGRPVSLQPVPCRG